MLLGAGKEIKKALTNRVIGPLQVATGEGVPESPCVCCRLEGTEASGTFIILDILG